MQPESEGIIIILSLGCKNTTEGWLFFFLLVALSGIWTDFQKTLLTVYWCWGHCKNQSYPDCNLFLFLNSIFLNLYKSQFPSGQSPLSLALAMSRYIMAPACTVSAAGLQPAWYRSPGAPRFWHRMRLRNSFSTSRWRSPGMSWELASLLHLLQT